MTADERLVDRIYEAAAFPDHWPDVLDTLARRVDAAGVVLFANSTVEWSGRWEGWTTSPGIHEAFVDFVKKGVATRTKATPRLLAMDRPGFVPDNIAFTREEWLREPHVVEWSRDWGFDHAVATAIRSPSGELAVIHLERRAGRPEFSRQDLDLLDSFRPHLARALTLAARWRLERLRTAADALAAIGLPALVIDGDRRVLAANDLIETLRDYLRWLARDRIAFTDPIADAMLCRGLSELGSASSASVRSFVARSNLGKTPIIAHLVPTPGRARDLFDGALGVLMLTPVKDVAAPDAALIRGLFDLTPNEARAAQGVAKGLTVDEMARRHGVGRETIRSQIKAVLAKTGARHQVEVASLLQGLPRFPVIAR